MVPPGKDVFLVSLENEADVKAAREALNMVKAKLPCRTKLNFQKLK